jgi:O-antigen/teichoic acid export membrane protein
MRQAFLLNIFLLLLVNVLIKPFFIFGIDLSVQNQTAPGAYGLYFALLNWTFLFQIVGDFGLQNYNTKHVSGHPHLLEPYFARLLTLKIALSAGYFVVAWLAALWIGRYSGAALGWLALLLVNQILTQMTLFLRTNLSGLGFYKIDSLLSALDKFLMLLFCGAALWWWHRSGNGPFPMEWFILAQTAALLATVAVVAWVLAQKRPVRLRWQSGPYHRKVLLVLLRKSLPFAVVILLMSAYTRLDGIFLERLLPDGALHNDIFAGAYRLLDALNMFGYLFASLLLPMFSKQLAAKTDIRPLTHLGFRLIWTGSFTACVAVMLHSYPLAALMFDADGSEIAYRTTVSRILIWSFAAVCITYIFSTLLTAGEQLRAMNRFFIGGIALDIALNLALVPTYKAIGSSVASVVTQGFVALGMVWLCYRVYEVRPTPRGVFQFVLFMLLTVGVAVGVQQYPTLPWFWQFAGALVGGGASALVSGWVSLKRERSE